jgi:hypothetical protein
MGCWNKTCGLSNLPILHGDEVLVFTLVRNDDPQDYCYTTALYSPVQLPFYSTYDDYGAGESSSGIALPIIIDAFSKSLVEMDVGENTYNDIAVKRDGFNVDKYFEAIHKNRLNIAEKYSNKVNNVQFVMFHKGVVDYILENYTIQKYVRTGPGREDYKYISYKFADVVSDLPDVIGALCATVDDEFDRFSPMNILSDFRNNLAAEYLDNSSYRYSSLVRINTLVYNLIKDKSPDLRAILLEHLTFKFIDSFMMSTRKVWIPGCHEGSQGQDSAPYQVLLDAMKNVLDSHDVD